MKFWITLMTIWQEPLLLQKTALLCFKMISQLAPSIKLKIVNTAQKNEEEEKSHQFPSGTNFDILMANQYPVKFLCHSL